MLPDGGSVAGLGPLLPGLGPLLFSLVFARAAEAGSPLGPARVLEVLVNVAKSWVGLGSARVGGESASGVLPALADFCVGPCAPRSDASSAAGASVFFFFEEGSWPAGAPVLPPTGLLPAGFFRCAVAMVTPKVFEFCEQGLG